jgi:hypothetical protein
MDYVELVEKKQLAALMERRRKLVETNGIEFYRPHYKQHLFHSRDKRYRYVRCGNRWGKSQSGTAEDVAWALGERVWYKNKFDLLNGQGEVVGVHEGKANHPLVTQGIPQRPTKGCILVQDWDKAEDVFTSESDGVGKGKLFQYIPKKSYLGPIKGGKGQVVGVKVKSRWGGVSTIMLDTVRSFKQDKAGHESSAWDYVHIDEPVPEDMWFAYRRGLMDTGGPMWCLCTQLNEPWLNDFFIPNPRMELSEEGDDFGDRFVITGSSFDNPYIRDEEIQSFADDLSEEARQIRIYGGSSNAMGLVYDEFHPELHTYHECPVGWKSVNMPPSNYTIRFAIDYHSSMNTPATVLFAATAPTGHVYFYEEIFDKVMIPELCERILNIVDGNFVALAIMDPHAFIVSPRDGSTAADDFEVCGIFCDKAPKDLTRGILATNQALKERMPDGGPWLNFGSHLLQTHYEFDRYIWDPQRPGKPRDENDHMMECLYRLVISGLEYRDPEEYTSPYVQTRISLSNFDTKSDDIVMSSSLGL